MKGLISIYKVSCLHYIVFLDTIMDDKTTVFTISMN
jgi:hypothetical protein